MKKTMFCTLWECSDCSTATERAVAVSSGNVWNVAARMNGPWSLNLWLMFTMIQTWDKHSSDTFKCIWKGLDSHIGVDTVRTLRLMMSSPQVCDDEFSLEKTTPRCNTVWSLYCIYTKCKFENTEHYKESRALCWSGLNPTALMTWQNKLAWWNLVPAF